MTRGSGIYLGESNRHSLYAESPQVNTGPYEINGSESIIPVTDAINYRPRLATSKKSRDVL